MTQEEFQALGQQDQEYFLNNGGVIQAIPKAPEVSVSHNSTDDVEPRKQVEQDVPSTSSDQSQSPQPAIDLQQWNEGFDILDPVELLYILDDDIASGKVKLHKWQVQFMLDFASSQHTKDFPFRAEVQACNGSGKDKYIVAACIVWLCMRFKLARGVATNGSGVQLDNQTELYIRQLCTEANKKFAGGKELVWNIKYRYYECLVTQSPIVLFATDEANKAEGYHPLVAGGKMALFASEAKAIPDAIFTGLTRCTGFTHRVDVSTPGPPVGYFYDKCVTALARESITDLKAIRTTDCIKYHITAFDCPHITASEIEAIADSLPGGTNNPVYKSAVLAEFSTTDEMVVIPYTYIWKAVNTPVKGGWIAEPHNKAGLDLSDGGAETVLFVRNGNKHLKTIPFKFDNTEDTIDFLEEQFRANDLVHRDAYIYADCCGMGKPMLNALRRRGWTNIRYVDSRHAALEPKTYANRGTELFFHMRILLERHELILLEDKVLLKQLSTRYYKLTNRNVHQLLSKLEQRSRGYPSPDRADAANLAFWDYKSTFKYEPAVGAPEKPHDSQAPGKPQNDFSMKSWASGKGESLDQFRKNLRKGKDFSYLSQQLEQYNQRQAIKVNI